MYVFYFNVYLHNFNDDDFKQKQFNKKTNIINKPINNIVKNNKYINNIIKKSKPIDKPIDKPTENNKNFNNFLDKLFEKPIPINKPINKLIEKPINKPIDKPINKPINKLIDKPINKPTENTKNFNNIYSAKLSEENIFLKPFESFEKFKDERFEKFKNKLNEKYRKKALLNTNFVKKPIVINFKRKRILKRNKKILKFKSKNLFYRVKRLGIFRYFYARRFLKLFKYVPHQSKKFVILRKKKDSFFKFLKKKKTRFLSVPVRLGRKQILFFKKRKNFYVLKFFFRQVTLMRKYSRRGLIYFLKHFFAHKIVLFNIFFQKNIRRLSKKFKKRVFFYSFYMFTTKRYRKVLQKIRRYRARAFRNLFFFRRVLFRYNKYLIFRNKHFFLKKKFIPVTKRVFKESGKINYLSNKIIIFKKGRKKFLTFFRFMKRRKSLKILVLKLKYFKFCFKFYFKLKSNLMLFRAYKNFRKIKQIKLISCSVKKKLNLFFLFFELGILSIIYRLFYLKSLSISLKLIKDLAIRVNNFIIYSKFYKTKINDIIMLNPKSLLYYFYELKLLLFPLIKWQLTPYSVTSYKILAGIYFYLPLFLFFSYPNFYGLTKKIFSFFVWFLKYNFTT